MKLVIISDTHGEQRELRLPAYQRGDILVHCGDITNSGEPEVVGGFCFWARTNWEGPIVAIAGNHDWCFERHDWRRPLALQFMKDHDITYLHHESCEIDGLKFFGSPYTPEFCNWAFNVPRGMPLKEKWWDIPEGTDVLITHGPPDGVLDFTLSGEHVGDEQLAQRVLAVKPNVHCFGHIHEAHGTVEQNDVTYVNASSCDARYRPVWEPVVIEL